MRIGLIDVDGHNFPNLALMKLSAYHKANGDSVEWWNGFIHYDRVYMSKVFDFTPDEDTCINADNVIQGGTGYNISSTLLDEIEHTYPDYALYDIDNTAYGYITRGCPRRCPFCIVAEKEGAKSAQVADVKEFWNGQKQITLLDPNILAAENADDLLKMLVSTGAIIDFTQGLDARFVDENRAKLLLRCKSKQYYFAWDNPKQDLSERFIDIKKWFNLDCRKLVVYVLTNYNSTMQENLHRINTLNSIGLDPYVMVYDKQHAPREIRQLQRWCNNRFIFHSGATFEQYQNGQKGVNP